MSRSDPTRWRSDPNLRPPGAELLLRAARRPQPPAPDDIARLAAVVDDIPRRSARSARWVTRFATAAVAGATLLALGTGVWAWRGHRLVRTPEPEAPALRAPRVGPAQTEVAPAPLVAPAPPPAAVPAPAPGRLPRRERAHRAAPVETETDTLNREIALIDAARGALEGAPAQSLVAVDRHRRQFPHGQLAAEREFLAVEALRRLGRTDEARRRAGDLAARYPGSSYAARALRSLPPP